jgi:CHAD domain-containing protein
VQKANAFTISSGYTEQGLVDSLENEFGVQKDETVSEHLTLLDTFDWRLFEASLTLHYSGTELILRQLENGDELLRQPIDDLPTFVWDLPDCALRAHLEPIIEMRALLKVTEAGLVQSSYRILNKDDKTVARFTCETLETDHQPAGQPLARQLQIKPIRGYPKPAKKLRAALQSMGLEPDPDSAIIKMLEAGDRSPAVYSAGLKVELEPTMRADEATKAILRSALRVIRLNEAGVKQDIDTEFLHDFRVAVRRTRSVLSQVKGVFPEEETLRFRRDFATIGKLSNELRDLDVYLLAEDNFKAMLPDPLRDDIEPLFDFLRHERSAALQKVIDGLNSAHYADTIRAWERFLNEPPREPTAAPKATVPIKALAQNRIYKRYRRIVKWGNKILENTEDEQLHALRIECKKLRYLMDFFQSLFPGEEITMLIKQVKKLQTNLGDFNDLCVQEEYLLDTVSHMTLSGAEARKVFVAVGCLIGTIQQEREQVKAHFAETFTAFATRKNQKAFRKLFAAKKQVK